MKRAFIVAGAESSGTRLVTEMLVTAGCKGDSGHEQRLDFGTIGGDSIVWRRSVPHANEDLMLSDMLSFLRAYKVTVIVVVRNWDVTERSQMNTFHKRKEVARHSIRKAYHDIFAQIISNQVEFEIVTYESFVLHPQESQQALFTKLGLQGPSVQVRNENTKHWGEK